MTNILHYVKIVTFKTTNTGALRPTMVFERYQQSPTIIQAINGSTIDTQVYFRDTRLGPFDELRMMHSDDFLRDLEIGSIPPYTPVSAKIKVTGTDAKNIRRGNMVLKSFKTEFFVENVLIFA